MITTAVLSLADFPLAATWLSDPEVNRWLGPFWRGRAFSDKALSVVAMNPHNRLYMVRQDDKPVGLVGLGSIDDVDLSALLWYLLGDRCRGSRGIITEAVSQVVRTAFRELGLHSISASIVESNRASERVLQKVGFRWAGLLRQGLHLDGQWVDRVLYDLLPGDLSSD